MEWFYLTLVSAFSLALADAFSKKYFQQQAGFEMLLVRFTLPGVILLPIALQGVYPALGSTFWYWMAALIPLELVAMTLYSLAIRDSPLYLTLPYLAFTPVFNVITGKIFLGETVSTVKLLGILFVVSGAYLLNFDRRVFSNFRNLLLPFKAITSEKGSRLMLVVALIYSFTSVMGKVALGFTDPSFFGAFYFVVLGGASLIFVAGTRPRYIRVFYHRPHQVAIVAICMCVMVVSHFVAIAHIQVAYMVSVKRTSLLFGMVLGSIMFGEKKLIRNVIAGTIMVIGVAVIVI